MKNNIKMYNYTIDEFVDAYPDQNFLHDAQIRTWKRLQEKTNSAKQIVNMRRLLTMAAVLLSLLICTVLYQQLSLPELKDNSAKVNSAKIYQQTASIQPSTVHVEKQTTKFHLNGTEKKISLSRKTSKKSSAVNMHLIEKDTIDVYSIMPDLPIQQPLPIVINFSKTDTVSKPITNSKKQKTIPPSANELLDGMQKIYNSKLKFYPIENKRTDSNTSNQFERLIPFSFN